MLDIKTAMPPPDHFANLTKMFDLAYQDLKPFIQKKYSVFVNQFRAHQDGNLSFLRKDGFQLSVQFDGHGGEVEGYHLDGHRFFNLGVKIAVLKVAFFFREVRTKRDFEKAVFETQEYLASAEYEFFGMGFTYAISVFNPNARQGLVFRMGDIGILKVSKRGTTYSVSQRYKDEVDLTNARALRKVDSPILNLLKENGFDARVYYGSHAIIRKGNQQLGNLVANVAMTDFGLEVARLLYNEGVCRIHEYSLKKNEFLILASDGLDDDYAKFYKGGSSVFYQKWFSTQDMPKPAFEKDTDDCSFVIIGARDKLTKRLGSPTWFKSEYRP